MGSIARPQSLQNYGDHAEGVHGVSWKRIFRLRDSVARRFYRKFHQQIPLEEFLSEGNQALVESLIAFDPTGAVSLTTHLYRFLSKRLWDVPKREWRGTSESTYAEVGRHARRISTMYKAPTFVEIPGDSSTETEAAPQRMPEALTTRPRHDVSVYLHECLTHLAHRTTDRERTYLLHSLDGDDCAAIGRLHGRHKTNVQRALHQVRHRLTQWADATSYAAAD